MRWRTPIGPRLSQNRARRVRNAPPLRRTATVPPLLPYTTLTKKTRSPAPRRIYTTAASVLTLCASYETQRLHSPAWPDRPNPPEALGNLLQQIAARRPIALLVFQSLAVEILAQLG